MQFGNNIYNIGYHFILTLNENTIKNLSRSLQEAEMGSIGSYFTLQNTPQYYISFSAANKTKSVTKPLSVQTINNTYSIGRIEHSDIVSCLHRFLITKTMQCCQRTKVGLKTAADPHPCFCRPRLLRVVFGSHATPYHHNPCYQPPTQC